VISGNVNTGVSISGSTAGRVVGQLLIGGGGRDRRARERHHPATAIAEQRRQGVGGTTAADRNIISANNARGVGLNSLSGVDSFNNTVTGNYIGTDVTGTQPLGNGPGIGIGILSANVAVDTSNNTITNNLVSAGYANGININGTGNVVQGNRVGTDVTGSTALANASDGISVNGSNNTIGGTNPGEGNLISGNTLRGLFLIGNGNTARGNLIGTNAAGTAGVANKWFGVQINGNNNTVGGTTAAARNIISGNGFDVATRSGLLLFSTASGNTVLGNYIGTDINGTSAIGNAAEGISVGTAGPSGPVNNVIGGVAAGSGNVIAFNNSNGITIAPGTSTGIAVRGNSIFSNNGGPGLGIDLGGNGSTANDSGDADTGANNLQNFPVLSSATKAGGNIQIRQPEQ
jgi:hypothetical protein